MKHVVDSRQAHTLEITRIKPLQGASEPCQHPYAWHPTLKLVYVYLHFDARITAAGLTAMGISDRPLASSPVEDPTRLPYCEYICSMTSR
jgi:hypothetical protein